MQIGMKKKAGAAIFISDKIDFIKQSVKQDKEGHYVMLKDTQPSKKM